MNRALEKKENNFLRTRENASFCLALRSTKHLATYSEPPACVPTPSDRLGKIVIFRQVAIWNELRQFSLLDWKIKAVKVLNLIGRS